MKVHNHHCATSRLMIVRGRSLTKKYKQKQNLKKPFSGKSSKKQKKSNSTPYKNSKVVYRFDPWWLPSNYPLKAIVVPFSFPASAGEGETVNSKGGIRL